MASKPEPGPRGNTGTCSHVKIFIGVAATPLVLRIPLNIATAVFSNEYDDIVKSAPLLSQFERVRPISQSILSFQKIHHGHCRSK